MPWYKEGGAHLVGEVHPWDHPWDHPPAPGLVAFGFTEAKVHSFSAVLQGEVVIGVG